MKDPRQLPVEPLSERAWDRVRTEVFAELENPGVRLRAGNRALVVTPRKALGWGLLVVAAAAVAVLSLRNQPPPVAPISTSRIVASEGTTRATIGDIGVELTSGAELLSTGSDATGHVVVLERGDARFNVPPRGRRAPFRVHAGEVIVEVVGTEFTVSRAGDRVRVGVSHGSVRVSFRGDARVVRKDEAWSSHPGRVEPPTPEPAPVAPSASASVGIAARRPAPVGRSFAAAPPASTGSVQAPPPSARARYEAATSLEAKDPGQAVTLYLAIASENGPWSANALFAAARLELERGRRPRAMALLRQYLERFPRGANAEDARALLARFQSNQ